jgi:hypothetical protein
MVRLASEDDGVGALGIFCVEFEQAPLLCFILVCHSLLPGSSSCGQMNREHQMLPRFPSIGNKYSDCRMRIFDALTTGAPASVDQIVPGEMPRYQHSSNSQAAASLA